VAQAYRYHSLEDFLIANCLTVDGQLDDGWGATFPVKGREIDATVLFADITAFSSRTADLSPTETLAFVNTFFAWVSAEALQGRNGIIDKYIGDEVMIVFSKEFGSADPFGEAVQAARWMADNDAHSFRPHIGLASGRVIVGYVGTALRYNCSVFGAPVALAARCAAVRPEPSSNLAPCSIVFPESEWQDRSLDTLFPATRHHLPDGSAEERPHSWESLQPREVIMKSLGTVRVRELIRRAMWFPSESPMDKARRDVASLLGSGRYWPRPD